jgi:aminoglycoside phosphotransferase (APT) family kinase protein
MTVMDPPGLRLGPLQTWLRDHDVPLDLGVPPVPVLFTGGRSNVTYRLDDASGRSVVLRRPPLGHVMPSAHDMAREFRVLTGMNRVGFPAPEALLLCEDSDVIGSPFIIMSFVSGRVVSDPESAAHLTPEEASDISAALISTMARLHAVDVSEAGLAELGRPQGYLPRQLDRWTRQWEITKTRDLPAMDALRSQIGDLLAPLPADLPWSLVHGDFRLDNCILSSDSPDVIAVLDWEMSTLGDPLSDLALILLYWTRPTDVLRHRIPVSPGVTERPGFWDRSQIIEAYQAASGRAVDHLDACTALACFKLAVITESIHARTLGGQQLGTAASDLTGMGVATESLAEMGLNVVRHGTVDGLAS